MKCGARVAIGVVGGYFLGRTKKMKLALMLGGMAAGRRSGGPTELLGRGAKLLESSPELAALREQVQGRLVEAGKGAVLAVATRQIESLSDRVSQRVERLAEPGRVDGLRDVVDKTAGRPARNADDGDEVQRRTDENSVETESTGDGGGRDEPAERVDADSGSGGTAGSRPADRERPAGASRRGAGNRETRSSANPRRAAGTVSDAARAGGRAATGRVRRGTRSER
jgi:hypothetical protein